MKFLALRRQAGRELFREAVDVFPATHSDADVLRHVREYFDGSDVPRALDMGVGIADRDSGGGRDGWSGDGAGGCTPRPADHDVARSDRQPLLP